MLQPKCKTTSSFKSGSKKQRGIHIFSLAMTHCRPRLNSTILESCSPITRSIQLGLPPFYSTTLKNGIPPPNIGPPYFCVTTDNFFHLIFSAFLSSTDGDVSISNLFFSVSKRHILCTHSQGYQPANSNQDNPSMQSTQLAQSRGGDPPTQSDACTLRGSCSTTPGGKWVERSLGDRLSCNFIWTRWLRGRCVGG